SWLAQPALDAELEGDAGAGDDLPGGLGAATDGAGHLVEGQLAVVAQLDGLGRDRWQLAPAVAERLDQRLLAALALVLGGELGDEVVAVKGHPSSLARRLLELVADQVAGDGLHPVPVVLAAPEVVEALVGVDEGLLDHVLGDQAIGEHEERDLLDLGSIAPDDLAVEVGLAAADAGDQLVDRAPIGRSRSRRATRRFAWGHGAAVRTGRALDPGGALDHPLRGIQAVSIL